MSDASWEKIFLDYDILSHDFDYAPFKLTAKDIKKSCQDFEKTAEKEVRLLCKQDSRESVPSVMANNGLFLLPTRNGEYALIKGEGYFDIPEIMQKPQEYNSKIPFELETSKVGNSEMQHLDLAYASSVIRTFFNDDSLVLTIRGRKYTSEFSFRVNRHKITAKSVQTEVDAGYEGRDKIVLVEAKNSKTSNSIIRQLFYPFRQWSAHSRKQIYLVFFEKRDDEYMLWQYQFKDENDYNSIELIKSCKYYLCNTTLYN